MLSAYQENTLKGEKTKKYFANWVNFGQKGKKIEALCIDPRHDRMSKKPSHATVPLIARTA